MTASTQPELNALASAIALMDTPETTAPMTLEATKVLSRIDLQAVALARFGDWREHVKGLVTKYGDVAFDLSTIKKIEEAKEVRKQIRDFRIGADKISKALKSQLRTISTAIGTEAEAVAASVTAVEAHVHEQIEAEETRRAEAATKEKERKAGHEMNLARIRSYVEMAQGKTAAEIALGIQLVQDTVTIDKTWEEFEDRGIAALEETLQALRALRDETQAKEDREAEAERLRVETEARAAEVKTVGEIQAAAMSAFGKRSGEIERVAQDLRAQHANNGSAQVQMALEMTLANLNMMAVTAKQSEQLLATAAPAPVEAANIVAKAQAIVTTAERAPVVAQPAAVEQQDQAQAPEEEAQAPAAKPQQPVAFDDMDDSSDAIDVEQTPAARVEVTVDVALPAVVKPATFITHFVSEPVAPILTTQEINGRLGLIVSEVMLLGLGLEKVTEEGQMWGWRVPDFDAIVDGLIAHLQSLKSSN